MLKEERKYQFRERLNVVHPRNIRDYALEKAVNEIALAECFMITVPSDAGDVLLTGARDFCEFLLDAMDIAAGVSRKGAGLISVKVDPAYGTYKAFRAEITPEAIVITAHDERGAAQGLFFLEEEMSSRHAPYLKCGVTERAPRFSPRMTHSGYGLDEFPDSHLAQIAHAGMDAILVMTCGTYRSMRGETDFNDLIRRAAKWGLDVYAYSYYRSLVHPLDAGAEAHYENTYGELFRQCPGLKGVVLVGESVGFPTRDPKASPRPYYDNIDDGIPCHKPSADFWPCTDYREWLMLLQSVIYRYNPNADIVFWSYNWGYADVEARQALIRSLPAGISLLVTFETFEPVPLGEDIYEQVYDYTISFVGPGQYFISEAKVAQECGIRLYSMTNTGGNTWDMGGVPYLPMPSQWQQRAKAALEAREHYGMHGVMECHQYGFFPSIISEMVKYIYETGSADVEETLVQIVRRHFGFGQEAQILSALECFSEAIRLLPPSGEDQCGAFRVGPSFPFSVAGKYKYPKDKSFMISAYQPKNGTHQSATAMSGVRIPLERKRLEAMLVQLKEGCERLEKLPDKNEELCYLINLGHFMECFVITGIHAKDWYLIVNRLPMESDKKTVERLIAQANCVLDAERENVLRALPIVKRDSRLGWDPRMNYVCDSAYLEWKLKLLEYAQQVELERYKTCNNFQYTPVPFQNDADLEK